MHDSSAGHLPDFPGLIFKNIEARLSEHAHVASDPTFGDVGPMARFIERCLVVDPNHRATPNTLLDDEWLSSYPEP
jgi:serine/threonine protein kinase